MVRDTTVNSLRLSLSDLALKYENMETEVRARLDAINARSHLQEKFRDSAASLIPSAAEVVVPAQLERTRSDLTLTLDVPVPGIYEISICQGSPVISPAGTAVDTANNNDDAKHSLSPPLSSTTTRAPTPNNSCCSENESPSCVQLPTVDQSQDLKQWCQSLPSPTILTESITTSEGRAGKTSAALNKLKQRSVQRMIDSQRSSKEGIKSNQTSPSTIAINAVATSTGRPTPPSYGRPPRYSTPESSPLKRSFSIDDEITDDQIQRFREQHRYSPSRWRSLSPPIAAILHQDYYYRHRSSRRDGRDRRDSSNNSSNRRKSSSSRNKQQSSGIASSIKRLFCMQSSSVIA